MTACLLTTQQRSGPNSSISKFLTTNPYPLSYQYIIKSHDIEKDSYEILVQFGGIRRTNRISDELKSNFKWLENNGWSKILKLSEKLIEARKQGPVFENIIIEREACLLVQNLKGIGPKQSRNLWQALGFPGPCPWLIFDLDPNGCLKEILWPKQAEKEMFGGNNGGKGKI